MAGRLTGNPLAISRTAAGALATRSKTANRVGSASARSWSQKLAITYRKQSLTNLAVNKNLFFLTDRRYQKKGFEPPNRTIQVRAFNAIQKLLEALGTPNAIVLGIHGSDFPGSEIGCCEPGIAFQD